MCSNKKNTSATEAKAFETNTSATHTNIETLNFTVEEAPAWTALFNRTAGLVVMAYLQYRLMQRIMKPLN